MKYLNFKFLGLFIIIATFSANANIDPRIKKKTSQVVSPRAVCRPGISEIDMDVNNVRARLRTGGDVWWDGSNGLYVVPKPAEGQKAVSSIYAGGVWVGGLDGAGNLKLAGVTYRRPNDDFDWFPGPLDKAGQTDEPICKNWDDFFTVNGDSIRNHVTNFRNAVAKGQELDCETISKDILYWPGKGNPYWREKHDFDLPDQELGAYWDNPEGPEGADGIYNPCHGDFPTIEIRGCEPDNTQEAIELVPDQMVFWIYNDNGGVHRLTAGDAIQMEVQVQSFAYATNDEINDMSFYRYKLINKADSDITDCYFAMWVDPDLGCSVDDFVGCDVQRSLAYTYNEDAVDGSSGTTCDGGVNTYGEVVPMVGTDYFRGPLGPKVFCKDKDGNIIYNTNGTPCLKDPKPGTGEGDTLVELGMTSFIYTNRSDSGADPATFDPTGRDEPFYNNIRGLWLTEEPMTRGGTGYNPGSTDTVKYALDGLPNDPTGWSMCTEAFGTGDRRTLQATGPLLLQPGAVNELIIGAVWVPDVDHPCPDISKLQNADDVAQALFDNCFDITDGPDAPDITGVELDKQLILTLTNDENGSNNKFLTYAERDLRTDNDTVFYKFEGYKVYQLVNAGVSAQELNDVSKARLILQTDLKNKVTEIFNWNSDVNINGGPGQPSRTWSYTRRVLGANKGLQTTFSVLEDQFAKLDRRLVNHKQYHFLVLAYAHNEYLPFNPQTELGQRTPYLEGRGNVKTYSLTPRPIVYENLNAVYGEGVKITRLGGQGSGENFLDLSKETREAIAKGTITDGKISYLDGAGPINVKIYNPLEVQDGKYRLDVKGTFDASSKVCALKGDAVYTVTDLKDNKIIASETSLRQLNEQIMYKKGFSVLMGQTDEPGTNKDRGESNGALGQVVQYTQPNSPLWFNALFDGDNGLNQVFGPRLSALFDPISNENANDPQNVYGKLGTGHFFPYILSRYIPDDQNLPFLSPASKEAHAVAIDNASGTLKIADLNNVDIVFTSNKDLWSRCIVVETASSSYQDAGFTTIDGNKTLEVRETASIGKDGKPDGSGTKGFGWFPGYAIDVETGKRLNIFFGENSVYRGEDKKYLEVPTGQKDDFCTDMIWNPSSRLVSGLLDGPLVAAQVAGGQHNIYVTRQNYDECTQLALRLKKGTSAFAKRDPIGAITWTCMPLVAADNPLKSIEEGLIPSEVTVKLRVANSYNRERKLVDISKFKTCDTEVVLPSYEFEITGKQSKALEVAEYKGALSNVNVVPNPYYAYSAYETSQFSNVIKITNLPERAIINIYSLDGKFIRKFNREERAKSNPGNNPANAKGQPTPDLEWDMKNFQGIPVASGVYLIHVVAPELGEERTIKWFGIGRKFDPSGL